MGQTSGALRQTEGSPRQHSARTTRKSVTLEALGPHAGSEPRERAKSCVPTGTCAASTTARRAKGRTGRCKIPNQANGLKPRRRNFAKSNINRAGEFLRQTGGKAVFGNFRCGKAVTAMWRRAVPRKSRPPKIFRRFATGRKGSGAGGAPFREKAACQMYPIWVQISPEWVQIQFRQICPARCSRAFNRACSALSLANPTRNFNSQKSSRRPAPDAAPFSASWKS